MTTQPIINRANIPSPGGAPPPPILACTRFNNKTWQEYQQWMTTHQQSYEQIYQRPLKCIYGSPREISPQKIPLHAKILVIEMNNDENQIMGIGEIQNQTANEAYRSNSNSQLSATASATTMKFKIFSDRNYTRYIYIGNTYYASREELERNHTEDAQYINKQLANIISLPQTPHQQETTLLLLQSLARLLFKGARHMKRGSGITRCPFAMTMLYASSSLEKTKRSSLST
jgi:hypothetical protein